MQRENISRPSYYSPAGRHVLLPVLLMEPPGGRSARELWQGRQICRAPERWGQVRRRTLTEAYGKKNRSYPCLFNPDRDADGIVMAAVVEKYVRYFRSIQHHCQWYFAKFLVCETLNFLLLFLNFWATDQEIMLGCLAPILSSYKKWGISKQSIELRGNPDEFRLRSFWMGSSRLMEWTSCNITKCLWQKGSIR